ncbi:hypothetical protein SBADM41S_05499 [Streptomyces badius]
MKRWRSGNGPKIFPASVEFPVHLSPRRRAAVAAPVPPPSVADATRPPLQEPRGRPPATGTHHPAGGPTAALRSVSTPLRPPGLDD